MLRKRVVEEQVGLSWKFILSHLCFISKQQVPSSWSTLRLLSQATGKEHKLSAPAKPEYSKPLQLQTLRNNIACRTLNDLTSNINKTAAKETTFIYRCIMMYLRNQNLIVSSSDAHQTFNPKFQIHFAAQ